MSSSILHREELHKQVWTTPMSSLAPTYGLSDVGLAKICRQMDIPVPQRGYWAKLKAGKMAVRKPLPKAKGGIPTEYRLDSFGPGDTGRGPVPPVGDFDLPAIKEMSAPKGIRKYHPLVEAVRKALESVKGDEGACILKTEGEFLNVASSRVHMNRACRLVESLLRALDEIDGRVELRRRRFNPTVYDSCAIIQDESIEFSLKEKELHVEHVPTAEEQKKMRSRGWYSPTTYDSVASNEFVFEIETYTGKSGLRRRWKDKPGLPLEEQIGQFVVGMIKTAPYVKQRRIEEEERQRREEQKRERLRLEKERRDAEAKKIASLMGHLKMYNRVKLLDGYLAELFRIVSEDSVSEERRLELEKWIEWVRDYRGRIDPLNPENLLYEHDVPEELTGIKKGQQQTLSYYEIEQMKKEPSFGWWDRPPWRW